MIWRPGILGLMLGCLIANVVEPSQAQQGLPRIWDIQLGSHVSTLPRQEFVEPACGNRGGPKGRVLAGFEAYASCAAEPDGLREVWFMYDDTREVVELARREPVRRRATTILDQPVILSLLISKRGYIQGYRIHTDPRAPESLRLQAHQVALHFKARFGVEDSCTDLASGDGETPVEGEFIKEHCLASVDGRSIVIDRRFYYRAGQQTADPNTGERMTNAFESSASLELRLDQMLERPVPKADPVVAADDPRSIFLQGRSRDCPGCQLTDVDLRYRNLEGAHLEGADLSGALLHAANLRGADLRHATLDRAIPWAHLS